MRTYEKDKLRDAWEMNSSCEKFWEQKKKIKKMSLCVLVEHFVCCMTHIEKFISAFLASFKIKKEPNIKIKTI
jgi:hypothetical protein